MDFQNIKRQRWESSLNYDAGSIITYNLAIGADGRDLPRTWEAHPNFHALPPFTSVAIVDIMGQVTRDLPKLLPAFQPEKHPHVHGEHFVKMKAPFPTAGTLATNARIVDVIDRRTGVAVVVRITASLQSTGDEIFYSEWTSFLMTMPGTGASKAAPRPAIRYPDRPPYATVRHRTTSEQGALYRAAAGEWNPMHIDPATAKKAGFPGPILSGTCTIGVGVKHVIDTCASGDSTRFQSVKLRLSKPVFPGELIETQMWREDNGQTIIYRQVGIDGRVVIAQAVITLKGGAGSVPVQSLL